MVRLVREIQDLRKAVFHIEQPHHDTQDAQRPPLAEVLRVRAEDIRVRDCAG
jgi:hypothetical protein